MFSQAYGQNMFALAGEPCESLIVAFGEAPKVAKSVSNWAISGY